MARIWMFDANINTDQIVPGRYAPYMLKEESALRQYPFIEARPDFAPNAQPGDLIVAGPNFGCGSSREYAPLALKMVGIGAIIAPLFARIFYRNALNLGIPLFEADLTGTLHDGQLVEFDAASGCLIAAGQTIQLPPPPAFVREVWAAGGIVPFF
ncbi:MAG TPA: homoaconitate hydratase, partial [Roseiflexaceae bacterium]|nr:homoaconitate hydratase [Roseiflexaceae bacterium]